MDNKLSQYESIDEKKGTTDNPLVSIVTPVLNSIKYLEECIQSVLNQSYPYIEHIFIDGGSTDGTLDMLISYKTRYPDRIRFISEPDENPEEAWNKGLIMAKGQILGWLGADDTYMPDTIQTVVEFFKANPDAYFVFGTCNYIDERSKVIKTFVTKEFNLKEAINNACYIPCPSAFYRHEVIEKVGLKDTRSPGGEREYWIRVGMVFQIHRINKTLSNFRIHQNKAFDTDKDFFTFARNTFIVGRRFGASIFSPCGRRYLLAIATRPLRPIVEPIFHFIWSGKADQSHTLVMATRPLHPILVFVFHLIVGQAKRSD